ncbi:PBECR4 domain-containing protein, partial [Streptomyces sp. NPDC057131]|uniref:PBECR4 domain-containing protein n=1 Tax=Streptomyces sp. NPDC057131 TaxID=3346027 RepID=UPI0036306518
VIDLHSLTEKPNLGKISLELLQEYFEKYLKPYQFTYHLDNGKIIELIFEDHRFCHLLGIETVAKSKFGKQRHWLTKPYRGLNGYQGIKDKKITFKSLKQLSGMFSSIKDKLIFFYLVPHMIESPEIFIDYVHDPSVSYVECKIMIFDILHGVQVHLGIEIQENGKYYPRTFLIERITDANDGTRFIANQPNKVKVEKIVKTEVTTGEIIKTTIIPQQDKEQKTE